MPEPGPTWSYLSGKRLDEGDQGGLFAQFARFPNERVMVMIFGTSVRYLLAQPNQARIVARTMREEVERHFGPVESANTIAPVTVIAERNVVRVLFPESRHYIAGQPEVFMALADHLEDAAKLIGD